MLEYFVSAASLVAERDINVARSSGLSLVMHNKRDDSWTAAPEERQCDLRGFLVTVKRQREKSSFVLRLGSYFAIDISLVSHFHLWLHLCISSLRNAISSVEDFVLCDNEKSEKNPKERKSKTVVYCNRFAVIVK